MQNSVNHRIFERKLRSLDTQGACLSECRDRNHAPPVQLEGLRSSVSLSLFVTAGHWPLVQCSEQGGSVAVQWRLGSAGPVRRPSFEGRLFVPMSVQSSVSDARSRFHGRVGAAAHLLPSVQHLEGLTCFCPCTMQQRISSVCQQRNDVPGWPASRGRVHRQTAATPVRYYSHSHSHGHGHSHSHPRLVGWQILTSDQARLPAEFKHINKRRKRN